MNDKIKIQLCREDFQLMLRNAVIQAGGADRLDEWMRMTVDEFIDVMAQNGIRVVYMPDRHMNSVKVTWEAPEGFPTPTPMPINTAQSIVSMPPIVTTIPKKRQLLCDSMDTGEDESDDRPGP